MFREDETCGRAIARIDPSRDDVKAMRHRETITNQKDAPFCRDSGAAIWDCMRRDGRSVSEKFSVVVKDKEGRRTYTYNQEDE